MLEHEYVLNDISIFGLWDSTDVHLSLNRDVNFLIGVNGSGKTTVINLVVAVLTADVLALDQHTFNRIEISFSALDSNKQPLIAVEKNTKDTEDDQLCFSIRADAGDKPDVIPIEFPGGLRRHSRYPRRSVGFPTLRSHRAESLSERISQLINLSWIPVYRYVRERSVREDERNTSAVDMKITDQANKLVRHLSAAKKRGEEHLHNFQRRVFLSLLQKKLDRNELKTLSKKTDVARLKSALTEVFVQFDLLSETSATKENRARFEQHFANLDLAQQKILSKNKVLDADELSILSDISLIDTIVKDWEQYREYMRRINESKDTFIDVFNDMFSGKRIQLSDSNELVISNSASNTVHISSLSSGEKQLLIVLTEALLQDHRPYVYITDEPEISLHVRWQEELVSNLRRINPNAQIFFATHSPDVVGEYSNKIFDMEDISNGVQTIK